jgi:Spy/CpxP family protein refolding chaperone
MRSHAKTLMTLLSVVCFAAAAMAQQQPPATGSISGVVRLADGTPAAGVRVTATRADAADAVTAMASLTQTDAMGRYRLENVPAGRYYVSAGRVDLPTYYPGTLILTQGITVSIATATTVPDIDFVIQDPSATVPPFRGGLRPRVAITSPTPFPNITTVVPSPRLVLPPNPPPPVQRPRAAVIPAPTRPGPLNFNAALQSNAAWWTNSAVVRGLGLTTDQRTRIEAIFEQHRQSILQNKTELEREETVLAQMLDAEPLGSSGTISAEIDKVIRARGEMEKTTSTMTLEMRQVLTRSQWAQLQTMLPHATTLPAPALVLPRR